MAKNKETNKHTAIKMKIPGTKENSHEIKWILKQQTKLCINRAYTTGVIMKMFM